MTDDRAAMYRIKPLEWKRDDEWNCWRAVAFDGTTYVIQFDFDWVVVGSGISAKSADSLSAAKLAAEQHYTARMSAGLEPVKVLGTLPVDKHGRVIGTDTLWTVHGGEVIECRLVLMKSHCINGNALAFEPDGEDDEDMDELHDLFESKEAALAPTHRGGAGKGANE